MQNDQKPELSNIFVEKDPLMGEISFEMKGKKFTQRLQEIGTDVFSTAHSSFARVAMSIDSEIKEDMPYLKRFAGPIALAFGAIGAAISVPVAFVEGVKNQFDHNEEMFSRQSFAERFNETHAEVMQYIKANKSAKVSKKLKL